MSNIRLNRWLAIIWTLIILAGCLAPHDQIPTELITWNDKFEHIALFILFGFLWMRAGVQLITVVGAGVFLGGFIEVLQYLLPINRSADWWDFAADFVGLLVGVGLAIGMKPGVKVR